MKGLLIKDLYNFKMQSSFLLFILVFGAFFTYVNGNVSFLVLILGISLPINAIAFDEKANWDKYALTMPVSRKDMVVSKYLLSVVLLAATTFLSIILLLVLRKGDLESNLAANIGSFFAGMMLVSLLLPLCFKFGTEKGRILLMVGVFGGVGIGSLFINIGTKMPFTLNGVPFYKVAWVVSSVILLLFVISMLISIRIYERKEIG